MSAASIERAASFKEALGFGGESLEYKGEKLTVLVKRQAAAVDMRMHPKLDWTQQDACVVEFLKDEVDEAPRKGQHFDEPGHKRFYRVESVYSTDITWSLGCYIAESDEGGDE